MNKAGKRIRNILIFLLCIVFISSIAGVLKTLLEYRAADVLYDRSVSEFTIPVETEIFGEEMADKDVVPPIIVDFEALRKVNEDIAGWIYCEETDINYPVLQGKDNDFYLHHTYSKTAGRSGSIFVDTLNTSGFADSNTIIYGHHMKNGSMFASLENWSNLDYYEEHPVFWLLTPEKNYKILLISGYTTAADSDTYTIYRGPCQEFEDYLQGAFAASDFSADVDWDANEKFVVLSTCSYAFTDARYVLHGMLAECE